MKDAREQEFLSRYRTTSSRPNTNQSILEKLIAAGGLIVLFFLNKKFALYAAGALIGWRLLKKYWRTVIIVCVILPGLFLLDLWEKRHRRRTFKN